MYSPYGYRLPNDTATWHPEPLRRGTFGLLSSCLITMGLCVWTSVHLNLPEPGKRNRQFWRKALWLVYGLFAPELVAWTAFQQNNDARRVRSEMNAKLIPDDEVSEISTWKRILGKFTFKNKETDTDKPDQVELDVEGSPRPKRYTWTMIHGHYAVMGGFAVDISDPSHSFHPKGYDKIILSGDDLLFLAKNSPESIPNIPESEIRDKSKANGLAKFLVCIQAFWFCVQCISRLAQGLSISLLELNTFAHALCTLLIYFLWWDKPLDIEEPTLLSGQNVVKLIAYLSSVMTVLCFQEMDKHGMELRSITVNSSGPWIRAYSDIEKQEYAAKYPVKAGYRRVHQGEHFHNFYFPEYINFVDISPAQQRQLRLCQEHREEMASLVAKGEAHGLMDRMVDWTFLHETDMEGLLESDSKTTKGRQFVIGFWVAGLVYGSLHLTAWNASFNTYAQEVLWKTSALSISLSGFGLALWIAFFRLIEWLNDQVWEWLYTTLAVLTLGIGNLLLVHYAFSRVYLVVECFLSIPHLPASVYEVPIWSQYFPHIG